MSNAKLCLVFYLFSIFCLFSPVFFVSEGDPSCVYLIVSVSLSLGTPTRPPPPTRTAYTSVQIAGSCRGDAPGTSEGYSGVKPHGGIHRAEVQ